MNASEREVVVAGPVAWSSGLDWHPNPHFESEMVVKLTRHKQAEHGFTLALYTRQQVAALMKTMLPDWHPCLRWSDARTETLSRIDAWEQETGQSE